MNPFTDADARATALETFANLPSPARTDETWRFANLAAAADVAPFLGGDDGDAGGFPRDAASFLGAMEPGAALSAAAEAALIRRSEGGEAVAGRMVFANDRLLSQAFGAASMDASQKTAGDFTAENFAQTLAASGVIWKPLERAAVEDRELFERHFMAHGAPLGGEKFAALHAARVRTGTFLYVPRGVKVELPLEAWHWAAPAGIGEGSSVAGSCRAVFPHTLIIAEEGSEVTFVDYFLSRDAEGKNSVNADEQSLPAIFADAENPAAPRFSHLAVGVNDLYAAPGARLTYVCVQEWSRRALAFQINNTHVARDAHVATLNVNLGGRYARTESACRLTGEGARSDMLAVTVADGEQEFDQRTFQDHLAPGATSDLLYKNAIDDRARTVFSGMIKVEPGAHRTDAYQKVRNLLLSDDAEANSMPGLEILADDVRCSHGATSGEIEPEELFYLLARGIPQRTARRLIVRGFLQEAVDRLGNPALAEALGKRVQARFGN